MNGCLGMTTNFVFCGQKADASLDFLICCQKANDCFGTTSYFVVTK